MDGTPFHGRAEINHPSSSETILSDRPSYFDSDSISRIINET